jgi:hypothetical protein
MGFEFVAFSNVICEPLPEEYRAKLTENNYELAAHELLNTEPSYINYSLMMNGHSYKDGKLYLADIIEYPKNVEKIEDQIFSDPNVIYIDWYNHVVYKRTTKTIEEFICLSYGFYEKLHSSLKKANGGELKYFPPSMFVAPEYGIVSAKESKICLQELIKLSGSFRNNELFAELYKVIQTASHSGIIVIK